MNLLRNNRILKLRSIALFLTTLACVSGAQAQSDETPLRIFGYFQNSFRHWTAFQGDPEQNSFSLQQLNLFFQKEVGPDWTAFVNFEFLNNFSSIRQWGSANLEEAWVKYSPNMRFNIKLGLLIPIFNNLNEIKNRTPLLPYIIRPLVYETSFNEFIPLDEFVPARAFVQLYGFSPMGGAKFDYALFLGNSDNINDNRQRGQTGVDTTDTFLVGGRIGFRFRELKLGVSGTYEKTNNFLGLTGLLGRVPNELRELPKTRLGGDLSYNFANVVFESEFITTNLDEGISELELDLDFYYATLGYQFSEQVFMYASYGVTHGRFKLLDADPEIEDEDIIVPTIGLTYNLGDRIRLKGQYARVSSEDVSQFVSQGIVLKSKDTFNFYTLAASIVF
jgi:hypothetical protein